MRAVLATLLLVIAAACGGDRPAPDDVATYEPRGEGGNTLAGGESPRTSDVAKAATVPSGCAGDAPLWVVSQTG